MNGSGWKSLAAMAGLMAMFQPAAAQQAGLRTAVVSAREVEQAWAAEGVVEAVRQSSVAAQVPGRITEMKADAGQRVARGQVLARIDDREAAAGQVVTQAQIARIDAEMANARVSLERTRKLVDQKFLSQAALDRAKADFDATGAQLGAARAAAEQAGAARSHATITAPYAGMIAARQADLGDMAQPGRVLFMMYEPGALRVLATVPQARLAEIRAQGSAWIELPGKADRIRAKSLTVLPAADPRTHTSSIRVELPAQVDGAYPGMFARVYFGAATARRLVIPSAAVVRRSEVVGAYVVGDGGRIAFRQLRLGEPAGEDGIEVLAGLNDGEKVALEPLKAAQQAKAAQAARN